MINFTRTAETRCNAFCSDSYAFRFIPKAKMSYEEANAVLNYWFGGGDRSKRPQWCKGGEEAAKEIRGKFGALVGEDCVMK